MTPGGSSSADVVASSISCMYSSKRICTACLLPSILRARRRAATTGAIVWFQSCHSSLVAGHGVLLLFLALGGGVVESCASRPTWFAARGGGSSWSAARTSWAKASSSAGVLGRWETVASAEGTIMFPVFEPAVSERRIVLLEPAIEPHAGLIRSHHTLSDTGHGKFKRRIIRMTCMAPNSPPTHSTTEPVT